MRLALGVIDLPYVAAKTPGAKSSEAPATTGKVAAILEGNYGVMGNFAALHGPDIAELLAISMQESLESLMLGAPASIDPFGAATSGIEQMFRTYLDDEEIDQVGVAGVPTAAALAGVSSRFKDQKGGRRPSFIDTGLYQSSFKAWVK